MTVNENMFKENWREIKGDIRRAWGKLSEDELENTNGDMKQVSSLISQRYGDSEESYNTRLTDIFHRDQARGNVANANLNPNTEQRNVRSNNG